MKKTIKDLKINDTVYFLYDDKNTEINSTKIDLISNEKIKTTSSYEGRLSQSDFTAWQFDATYSRTITFYLNREDLLQKILNNANKKRHTSISMQSEIVLKLLENQKLVDKIESEIENAKNL